MERTNIIDVYSIEYLLTFRSYNVQHDGTNVEVKGDLSEDGAGGTDAILYKISTKDAKEDTVTGLSSGQPLETSQTPTSSNTMITAGNMVNNATTTEVSNNILKMIVHR